MEAKKCDTVQITLLSNIKNILTKGQKTKHKKKENCVAILLDL